MATASMCFSALFFFKARCHSLEVSLKFNCPQIKTVYKYFNAEHIIMSYRLQ